MEAISLKKDQEINNIRLKPADNGGCCLEYEIYTPSLAHSDSSWENKMEVFTDGEVETVVLPRILELYKADYANAMAKNAVERGADQPMKASM